MPIIEQCDFCGKDMAVHDGKGIISPVDAVTIREKMCEVCTLKNLDQEWLDKQPALKLEWEAKETELTKFYKLEIERRKAQFVIAKKKEHYGSFYKE